MTICDTFVRTAISTWDKISESRKVGYQLKEETITDLNILELKKRLGRRILTIPFNKFDEGKNGADWEWWFKDKAGFWIGVRVQAKIINIKTDDFEHLHYKRKRKFQSEKIIKEALKAKPPRFPLYALYTQWDDNTILANWTCRSFPKYFDLYGCSTISAFNVYKRRTTIEKDLKSLLVDMRPWHCLVCCKGHNPIGQLTDRIESYIKNNFTEGTESILKELKTKFPKTFRTKNPPDYVEILMTPKETLENVNVPNYLDGLVIYLDEE
ncbi:MAG: DUF6615 family protein [Cyclobacteriaceae bacterium]